MKKFGVIFGPRPPHTDEAPSVPFSQETLKLLGGQASLCIQVVPHVPLADGTKTRDCDVRSEQGVRVNRSDVAHNQQENLEILPLLTLLGQLVGGLMLKLGFVWHDHGFFTWRELDAAAAAERIGLPNPTLAAHARSRKRAAAIVETGPHGKPNPVLRILIMARRSLGLPPELDPALRIALGRLLLSDPAAIPSDLCAFERLALTELVMAAIADEAQRNYYTPLDPPAPFDRSLLIVRPGCRTRLEIVEALIREHPKITCWYVIGLLVGPLELRPKTEVIRIELKENGDRKTAPDLVLRVDELDSWLLADIKTRTQA